MNAPLSTPKLSCSSKKNARFKVALITATRAEWGLLSPLAKALKLSTLFELQIIVTGAHLVSKFGFTFEEILTDGFSITHKIPILESTDTPLDTATATAKAIVGFTNFFLDSQIDMVIILGDRYEMLGVGYACVNLNIPIAHLCGGESTQGANDECIRHCLSKMSYVHFPTTNAYAKRIIQLGEDPKRVFNVGSLAVENILNTSLLTHNELKEFLDCSSEFLHSFCILTYHPVTLECASAKEQIKLILDALLHTHYYILATKANADTQGESINEVLQEYAMKHPSRIILKSSLGKLGYLSAINLCDFMIGNSSSALSEGVILRTPSVNIGDRQKGRIKADSVIDCPLDTNSILHSIKQASSPIFHDSIQHMNHIFGDGTTSKQIVQILFSTLKEGIELKKSFYDVKFEN